MKLDDLLRNPDALPAMERYVNEGTRTYSTFSAFNGVSPPYQPRSGTPSFVVPTVLAPRGMISIWLDEPNQALLKRYRESDTVRFPIHPEIFWEAAIPFMEQVGKFPRGGDCIVMPTASTRTVFVVDPLHPPHCLKLHCPRRISRFVRRLRRVSVEFSVMISRELRSFSDTAFAYLPETIGMAVGSPHDGWGAIVRELMPRPVVPYERYLIPFFALYGRDARRPDDPPLLVQLIERHHADPAAFTLAHLMEPVIRIWCRALRERGIVFGSHGQNLLLEVDRDFHPTRIIHRDLDLQVDPGVRTQRGLSVDFPKSRIGIDVPGPREAALSLKYDAFLGHHLLDYLAELLWRQYRVNPQKLREACRATFRDVFPDAGDFLTDRTYYYGQELSPDNAYRLVETDEPPQWR